jgi:hypothetical protein
MPIFKKQTERKHLLKSLLISLSFISPLESKHIKNIVTGFVYNERFYISNQKTRGYFQKQDDLLILTSKAKRAAQSSLIKLITNKTGGCRQLHHEVILARSLFLILLHLDFREIRHIKKQKHEQNHYIPDLTITSETDTLYIEIDTGSQPFTTLESKIRGFKTFNPQIQLIYFTNSAKTYSHFNQIRDAQFIYLQSQTLSQDIENLTPSTSQMVSNLELEKSVQNVFVDNESLYYKNNENFSNTENNSYDDFAKKRQEALKLLNDYD